VRQRRRTSAKEVAPLRAFSYPSRLPGLRWKGPAVSAPCMTQRLIPVLRFGAARGLGGAGGALSDGVVSVKATPLARS